MVPRRFFVTCGKALSKVSRLNAFDLALVKAGIAQCNLVQVSSILPPGCREVGREDIPVGAITHAVVARMDGDEGETVGAGVAWAWEEKRRYGLVAEAHGHMDKRALKEILGWKIDEMAENRGAKLGRIKYKLDELAIPMDHYGSVVSALVYVAEESTRAGEGVERRPGRGRRKPERT